MESRRIKGSAFYTPRGVIASACTRSRGHGRSRAGTQVVTSPVLPHDGYRICRGGGASRRNPLAASCRLLAAEGVIESVYAGDVRREEQERSARAAIQLAQDSGVFRFFTDLSGMTRGPTPGELVQVIDAFEHLGLPRTLREALVLPPGSMTAADVQFYEDACRNRGWNMRIFPDRARALAWLADGR